MTIGLTRNSVSFPQHYGDEFPLKINYFEHCSVFVLPGCAYLLSKRRVRHFWFKPVRARW